MTSRLLRRESDTARRYLAVVQDPRGYPPPRELRPADLPDPTIHTVVLAEDYERLLRQTQESEGPCGLCGGYGAYNPAQRVPVPCMSCGKASDGLVLVCAEDTWRPELAAEGQWRGLRVIEGGPDV